MHALPSHPRHPLLLGLVALLLALLVMAAAAPDLGTLDLSFGGSSPVAEPAPAASAPLAPGDPAWVTDPLRPPVETLSTPR